MTDDRRIAPSRRSERVHYAVRDVLAIADEARARGLDLVPLNLGDPLPFDFTTPPHLVEAVHRAMRDGKNGYADSFGEPEALEAIRAEAARKGIASVVEAFVANGTSEAIEIALGALVDRGDRVLVPRPGYPLYDAVLAKLEAEAVPYDLDEARGWEPDLDHVAAQAGPRTRAIVLIDPSNPTGAVCSRATLERLAGLAARHGLVVLADEIYDKLVFDGPPPVSIASLDRDLPVVTFNGLSKSYLAPGWRLGWAVVSGRADWLGAYREAIGKFLRARLCASRPMQAAVRPALEGSQAHLEDVRARLRRRRDVVCERLGKVEQVRLVPPRAGFYAFPSLDVKATDAEVAGDVIRETGVIVVPGSGFGQKPGTRQLRIVFLADEATLGRALDLVAARIAAWS